MAKLFGTDGVRGEANVELTPELAYALGRAGAYVLTKTNHHAPQIIVGTDTRISKDMLQSALISGMCSMGARVYPADVLPTPGIAYLVRKYKLDAGVVISASHNAFQDNGIKFFNREGYKLPDIIEDEIEYLIKNNLDALPRASGYDAGYISACDTALSDYVEFLKSTVPDLNLRGMKISVDCANGAAYKAGPALFSDLGADVLPIHNNPNGFNINDKCGSTHIESLKEHTLVTKSDAGFALDGDGDRLMCVDDNGNILDGDQIMAICGWYKKRRGELVNNTIVATVMSNLGFFLMAKEKGINIEKTNVGDRYVLERMLLTNAALGGEQSGHVIFLEHNTTGDGLITALQILKAMRETDASLSELNTIMEIMPQITYNAIVDNGKKREYLSHPVIKAEIDALEEKYKDDGRVLIRASGTEAKIRVMIEGRDRDMIREDAERVGKLIEMILS
ncbi:MAG: phosphoglucosamine mutase [Clostridiales bacterium]|jgi:phosphoglucosamine mutase|nr:phosphoglucosamine mutase [Clostridiales bacterium]